MDVSYEMAISSQVLTSLICRSLSCGFLWSIWNWKWLINFGPGMLICLHCLSHCCCWLRIWPLNSRLTAGGWKVPVSKCSSLKFAPAAFKLVYGPLRLNAFPLLVCKRCNCDLKKKNESKKCKYFNKEKKKVHLNILKRTITVKHALRVHVFHDFLLLRSHLYLLLYCLVCWW